MENYYNLTSSVKEYLEKTLLEKVACANERLELLQTASEIRAYLCDKSTINTPEYILKRYIFNHHTELMLEKAEDMENCDVHTEWDETTIEVVARKLFRISRDKHGLNLAKETWKGYLNGKGVQNRDRILQMAFVLQMDSESTMELLLSYNEEPYSVRTPLEFICLFLQKKVHKYTWYDVEDIMQKFREESSNIKESIACVKEGMTREMASMLDEFYVSNLPDTTLKNKLLEYMLDNAEEFRAFKRGNKKIYIPGYSLSRKKKFCRILQYLSVLYPVYYKNETDAINSKEGKLESCICHVGKCSDGYPKLHELLVAMFQSQDWNLDNWETSEADYMYQNFCSSCYAHGYAVDRLREGGNNVQFFNRKDALLFVYFLMQGYINQIVEYNNPIVAQINQMIVRKSDDFDSILEDIFGILDDVSEDDFMQKYDSVCRCVNMILIALDYPPLYVPLPFDRFIILSLMSGHPEELTCLILCESNIQYAECELDEEEKG